MFRRIRTHLSPATGLALVALFASLGGVSYAAKKIGTSEIKNGAVTAKKLKRNAVTTVKIRPNAVTGAKVAENTLSEVPKAAKADVASKADVAAKSDVATDSEKLGGHDAASFGSGILGATVSAPPVIANAASAGSGSPIGDGDHGIPMPVPVKAKNLFVRVKGDTTRPFTVSLTDGEDSLTCSGAGACISPASVEFQAGDVLRLEVLVHPTSNAFAGAIYQVGYQLTP